MGHHLSTTTTCSVIFILASAGLLFTGGETVHIKNLKVPEVVQNGSESSVILDCDYTLDNKAIGLVVKWFFNNHPAPVYQWIPHQKPQDLGVLKGKLNLDYRASDDENTKHRAMQIIRPTTELSGEYKCLVSTFDDEASDARKMVIYVPERSLELKQTKPKEDRVKVTCVAEGVYPEPNMTIHTDNPTLFQRVHTGYTQETKQTLEGLYDISATVTIEDREFESPTTFNCELIIPEANYTVSRSFVYYPGPPTTTTITTITADTPTSEPTFNKSFIPTDSIESTSSKLQYQWVFIMLCCIVSLFLRL